MYEVTGVGAAQLFFRVDRNTGQVYVSRDLKTDTLTRYEVSMLLEQFMF